MIRFNRSVAICSAALLLAGTAASGQVMKTSRKAAPKFNPPISINAFGTGGDVMRGTDDQGPITLGKRLWWDNGMPDGVSGQNSQSLATHISRMADDLKMKEGVYYHFDKVAVYMSISPGTVPDVCLELYDDCNGCPSGTPFAEYSPDVGEDGEIGTDDDDSMNLGPDPDFPAFDRWCIVFPLDWFTVGPRRIWLSPYGKGTGLYYWLTSGNGVIQGHQGRFQDVGAGYPDWTDGDQVQNLEVCSDYSYQVYGNCCCLNTDNSTHDLAGLASFEFPNNILWGSNSYDNFQIPPKEDREICRLEAWLATNCDVENSYANIYENNCDDVGNRLHQLLDPVVEATGEFCDGLPVYKLTWTCPGITLTKGQNYWLSVVALGSGNINERAKWLFKTESTCHINISEGRYRNPFQGIDNPTKVSDPDLNGTPRDFAFKLWTCEVPPPSSVGDNVAGVDGDADTTGIDGVIDVINSLQGP